VFGTGSSANTGTSTRDPAVPEAATSARALARLGAVHVPAGFGFRVYGQYGRYPGKLGGRIWHVVCASPTYFPVAARKPEGRASRTRVELDVHLVVPLN
jgi:hypothetical protein